MKKYLYVIGLVAAFGGMVSCSKNNDPAPDPVVVGRWTLARIRFSGYPTPFTSLNADRPSNSYGVSGSFTVKNDKSFTETFSGSIVSDFKGTWDFTNNTLELKYDNGTNESYTLDSTQDPAQLVSAATSDTDSLRASATSPVQAVPFRYQFVYTKQ